MRLDERGHGVLFGDASELAGAEGRSAPNVHLPGARDEVKLLTLSTSQIQTR